MEAWPLIQCIRVHIDAMRESSSRDDDEAIGYNDACAEVLRLLVTIEPLCRPEEEKRG